MWLNNWNAWRREICRRQKARYASAEFNRLQAALEGMRMALSESVRRVRDASSQIDTGSRELTAGNIHLATRTESTATSLEQTAASMEELTATVKQNAENADQAHQLRNRFLIPPIAAVKWSVMSLKKCATFPGVLIVSPIFLA